MRPAGAEPAEVALTAAELDPAFVDTQPGDAGAEESREGRRRRGRRGGRNRLGGSAPGSARDPGADALAQADNAVLADAGTPVDAAAADDRAAAVAQPSAADGEASPDAAPAAAAGAGSERGERRGRRRRPYRDRREGAGPQDETEVTEGEVLDGQLLAGSSAADDGEGLRAAALVGVDAEVAPIPAAAPTPQSTAARPSAAARVEAYVLPTDELAAIARAAGLEWVGSDADKVRTAQQAIADAPRPIRVPRERAPAPVVDVGPLVLVETRRDLGQIKLPFELESR
jgi:ribonuclease E